MKSCLRFFLLVLACTGCEEELLTRDHFETPFSLYGVLSPDLPSQSIRVFVVEEFPSLGTSLIPDANVTTTDLTLGKAVIWRDTILVGQDGSYDYAFWAPFRAEYGHRYRLEVEQKSDGAISFAEIKVPVRPDVEFLEDQHRAIVKMFIKGTDFRPLKTEIVYVVSKPGGPHISYPVSYAGREHRTSDGWQFDIKMVVDAYDVNYRYNADAQMLGGLCGVDFVQLRDFRLRALIADTTWNPPGGEFDPDVLSMPNTMDNVRNGLGFIGAGFRIDREIRLSQEIVAAACFIDGIDRDHSSSSAGDE